MVQYHKDLAAGRWQTLTLPEQMANIGSDVYRAISWFRKKDKAYFQKAFERALELFDLTLEDPRWKGRRKEIARCRELFCSVLSDFNNADDPEGDLDFLNNYFLQFGAYVRKN